MWKERPVYRFLLKTGAILLLTALCFLFVVGVHIQQGDRLEPNIQDGDLLIAYKLGGYRSGDAVLYRSSQTEKIEVARISAIHADTVELTAYRTGEEDPDDGEIRKDALQGKLVFLFRRRGL